ncbi:MAG: 50S ribosomal protein L30 [Acidimicrobiales bacterium]|nr:50S ribosomal protein L30 [Acidimicrobiales bacterium]
MAPKATTKPESGNKPESGKKKSGRKEPAGSVLLVTQTRSAIGTKPKHRGTLRALGLRGIGQSNELPDRPDVRGMLARVPHLISVEEVSK